MSKILNHWWYTTSDGRTIGIVKTIDEFTNEVKFRIGCGDGFNELLDRELICKRGDKFYPEVIK